jgi:hypothetical protein
MTEHNLNPNPNPDPNPGPANDNGGAIAPASKAGALASTALAALVATFKTVDTTPIGGRSVMPLMQFKSREGGIWTFGQQHTIPELDSLWAVNPASFQWGWVCWGDSSKILGEKLVPISQPLPNVTELPDKGFPWQQEMAVNWKCISGADAGREVTFKTNTVGGIQAITGLIAAIRDRLNGGQHDGKVSPVVLLEKGSYPHPQFGKQWTPTLTITDWMPLDGPAPVSEPASPAPTSPLPPSSAAEQPRRRRVG